MNNSGDINFKRAFRVTLNSCSHLVLFQKANSSGAIGNRAKPPTTSKTSKMAPTMSRHPIRVTKVNMLE